MTRILYPTRRALIGGGLIGMTAALAAPGAAVGELLRPTARQPLGPFYPDVMPLDRDNDLVRIRGRDTAAVGTVTHIHGRLTDPAGRVLTGARIEIWQCDANGRYIHTGDASRGRSDPHFQGYGHTETDGEGRYRFRTIRPVPYPGRTPHIHFAVRARGFDPLVTQMYVAGERLNARDGLLQSERDPVLRKALIVPLAQADRLETGALAGRFDIVLGRA